MSIAKQNQGPLAAVFDNTDVAVMLLHHWDNSIDDIFVMRRQSNKVWSVKKNQPHIRPFKSSLLALHGWSGSDTTSGIYRKGKITVLKTYKNQPEFQRQLEILSNVKSNQKEVGAVSIKLLKRLFGVTEKLPLSKIR